MRVLKNVHLVIIEGSMNQAELEIHHQSKNRLILILNFKRLFDTQDITQELYKTNLITTFHLRFSTSETEVSGSTERLLLTSSATQKTHVCKSNIYINNDFKMSKAFKHYMYKDFNQYLYILLKLNRNQY